MKLLLKAGTTSQLLRIYVQNSVTGAGLTGLTYSSSGLKWNYIRDDQSTVTQITPVTATVGTWTSAGFKEVDSTNFPGLYEIGVPNAALASSSAVQMILFGASNMLQVTIEIELTAVDVQSATAFVTSVPAVAGAVGSVTGSVASVTGNVNLNLGQAIPTSNTAQTLGDALNAARAQGFGAWTQNGTTLTLYAGDGETVVRTFTLNSSSDPTART